MRQLIIGQTILLVINVVEVGSEMKRKNKRLKPKIKKRLLLLLLIFCLSILIYNIGTLVIWRIDRNRLLEEKHQLAQIIDIVKITPEEPELINYPEDETDDYWHFINLPLINVNLNALREINPETVGFLSVGGTNINYPVVQTTNNEFYLNHSFRRTPNRAGWVFMDYRNNTNFSNRNTIIYAHGRIDGTMFGTLKTILNSEWINNRDNHIIRYSSKEKNMMFQVFSVYTIPIETYYLYIDFDDESYQQWLETMISRSQHDFNTSVNINDKVLTLSTCLNRHSRVVMHAKLIKIDRNN